MVETNEIIKAREVLAEKFGMGTTAPTAKTHSLSASNWTTIATINCNAASNDQLSDMVGFIITVLLQYGMIDGAVTA